MEREGDTADDANATRHGRKESISALIILSMGKNKALEILFKVFTGDMLFHRGALQLEHSFTASA